MGKETKYLKVEDLENGGFYRCRLSGNQVVVHITFNDKTVNVINASFYSERQGYYSSMIPTDYQLFKVDK